MSVQRPNILLITTDQQRFDAAGGAGPPFLRTPHFDHLRREGITFSRAYADCPMCVPSRVSIMTGRQAFSHGMLFNGLTSNFMGRDDTLPTRLRALGYQTAAIGKMHFGPQRARHGFDEMILPDDYYRDMARRGLPFQPMRHGLGQNELYPGLATVPESLTLTAWIAEQCVEYIRERRDPTLPFFLWCSFSKPHPPLDPPEPYYSMYRHCPLSEPVRGDWNDERCPPIVARWRHRFSWDLIAPEILREARAAYYGLITQNDYNMGRVFSALQDKELFRDTLILYTSDHGEYLGDHGLGAKGFFHEASAHVPFVLRLPQSWPDRRHGDICDSPITLADILPTLLAAGGTSCEPPSDEAAEPGNGRDLIALARGEAEPRRYLESVSSCTGASREEVDYLALTDGRWKYIWYPEGACEQLFDLHADPMEQRDLAVVPACDARREELREALIRHHQERASPYVTQGRLVERPRRSERIEDLRNTSWPGYHTDYYEVDVRH